MSDFLRAAPLSVAYYLGRKSLNPAAKLGDRLICAWPRSRGDFSHAEMVFGYSPDQPVSLCASASMRDGGVRLKHINLRSGRWVLRHVEAASDEDALRCRQWFVERLGQAYDWLGVAGFVLPGRLQLRRAVYCSEACVLAWGSDAKQVAPSELFAQHEAIFAERSGS